MNRNVSIVVVLLVLVVIAGYLIWLRSKVQPPVTPQAEQQVQTASTPEPTLTASPSATPTKVATSSGRPRSATPSSTGR